MPPKACSCAVSHASLRSLRSLFSHRQKGSVAVAPRLHATRNARERQLSTARPSQLAAEGGKETLPRWAYTPPQMKAPFAPRAKNPRKAWEANSDPAKLDAAYVKFLGKGGESVLTEDVKWLAVTHKSFDQGRRGFNDKLAYLGKRLLVLQSNLSLLHSTPSSSLATPGRGDEDTQHHPALRGLETLEDVDISHLLSKERISELAASYGIASVTRWKPRNPASMKGSGCDVVYTLSLYAILGALALQRGADVANEVAREQVLKPLGIS